MPNPSKDQTKQALIQLSYEFCYRLLSNNLLPEDQDGLTEKIGIAKLFVQKDIKEMSEEDKAELDRMRKAEQFMNSVKRKEIVKEVERYVNE